MPTLKTASLTCILMSRRITISINKQENESTVKNGDRQQIENSQIQAAPLPSTRQTRWDLRARRPRISRAIPIGPSMDFADIRRSIRPCRNW